MPNNVDKNSITAENSDVLFDKKQDPGLVVFVPEKKFDYSFWDSIASSGFDVFILEDKQEVKNLLLARKVDRIYIHAKDKSKHTSFASFIRESYPHVSIIFYKSIEELLVKKSAIDVQIKIIKDNFTILNNYAPEKNKEMSVHALSVVAFVEKLCNKFKISDENKLVIINTAYLHNFALTMIDNESKYIDEQRIIEFTSQYLKSIEYSTEVCDILDLMYKEISSINTIDENYFLANILTIADYYCHSKFNKSKLSPDEFISLNDYINKKTGTLFLPFVGQGCIDTLYETTTIGQATTQDCYVLIFNKSGEDHLMLKGCLENLGFEVVIAPNADSLTKQYLKHKPDILVIEASGSTSEISDTVDSIEEKNIRFDEITTYLLTNNTSLLELTGLLQKGIEDIFCVDNDLDPFLIKIIRTRNRIEEQKQKRMLMIEQMGTFGTLASMNLIDLLQMMNGNDKTCMISVTAKCHQLTIYIQNGIITYAENDHIKGDKAIYCAIDWKDGIWNIDHIDISEFPKPNINKSINSILLEGCQYMDESQRIDTTKQADTDNTLDFLNIE